MRTAVISDIHGNIVALESVLEDLERQGGADHIVVAGDLFTFCAAPNEVLARLRKLRRARFLLGNTDRYLLEGTYPSTEGSGGWQEMLLYSFQWTAEQLGREGLHFLEAVPSYQVITHGQRQLLAVHGSPKSDEEGLTVETEVSEFESMPIGAKVALLACGHTHVPMARTVGGVCVVNVGSVGLPFDGDPRACYAIVSCLAANGTGPTQVELRRVAYDVDRAIEQFYDRDHPAADIGAYNLRTARSIGTSLIYTPEMRCRSKTAAVEEW